METTEIVDKDEQISRLIMDEWEKSTEYVSDLDQLYEDLYSMLRGERPEKNYDWQSNVVINKVFQVIFTAVPYVTQKIFGANPIMGVKSFDKKGSWQRETILDFWYNMQHPKTQPFFITTTLMTIRAFLNGVSVMKKTWNQKLNKKKIERQVAVPMKMDAEGNETEVEPHMVTKTISIPEEDWPQNEVMNNKDLRWDWNLLPGQSIRHGRFVTHRSVKDIDSLKKSKLYKNLDEIECGGTTDTEEDHSQNTGKDGQDVKPKSDFYEDIEIYERQGLLPVSQKDGVWEYDEDGDQKEMVITIAKANRSDSGNKFVVIRFEPNPYKEKTYVDMHIYLDPERWQSMGLIEPFKDIQTALNDNINAMFDEIWQNLMPPVIVDKSALWDWDTMVYAPGQRWIQGGDPRLAAVWKPASNITTDAWQKHALFDTEIQLSSAVTPPMQGIGKEKAATTNVLNAQMSQGKLDFILKMIEVTWLIPNSQMDIRFATLLAHPLTFQKIVGEPFRFAGIEEIYRYTPAASSVKLDYQKEKEIQEDIQLIQIVSPINNPGTPKIVNSLLKNILRNRNMPAEADLLDEQYFEPGTEAGQLKQMEDQLMTGASSNQNGVPMSGNEASTRRGTFSGRGMPNF